MIPNPEARTQRLETRIAPDTMALVKRAAEIQGRSVSDFVVQAARAEACRTIEEIQIIRLSVADQQALFAALTEPPVPPPAMERAIQRHRELFGAHAVGDEN